MDKRIIYPNDEGGVSIIIPAPEALDYMSIEEIAAKDVPAGIQYKIVNLTDIPEDREFRSAWEVEIAEPDGVGIGHDAWFALQSKPV